MAYDGGNYTPTIWSREGQFYLATNDTVGLDSGEVLANFNDHMTDAMPDKGAHERGTDAMVFGPDNPTLTITLQNGLLDYAGNADAQVSAMIGQRDLELGDEPEANLWCQYGGFTLGYQVLQKFDVSMIPAGATIDPDGPSGPDATHHFIWTLKRADAGEWEIVDDTPLYPEGTCMDERPEGRDGYPFKVYYELP